MAEARTGLVGRHVYDKITGEHYGEYTISAYIPEPITYTQTAPKNSRERWHIEDDGTVAPIDIAPAQQKHLPCVIEHTADQLSKPNKQSSPGRNPQRILNPLAAVLYTLNLEQHPTPWLDDIAFGAIYTGPGVINGKQSVSLEDVMLVLRLPIITTAAAAERLLNHDRKPMSTRQIQRVVEAARIALRGLALYLERHPHIAQALDMTIDFDKLWTYDTDHTDPTKNSEHPKKQAALMMIRSKTHKKTIAKELGISKNTVKKWCREIDIELGIGGQPAPINDR